MGFSSRMLAVALVGVWTTLGPAQDHVAPIVNASEFEMPSNETAWPMDAWEPCSPVTGCTCPNCGAAKNSFDSCTSHHEFSSTANSKHKCGCRHHGHDHKSLWERESLTNGLFGIQPALAKQGIAYQGTATQFYQGVTSGGAEQVFRYGAKIDQYFIFDSEKLGLWKGGKMIMHAESALGQNSILDAAALAPANTAFLTPRIDDDPITAITNLQFEQELAGGYAVTFGRFNFIDLWAQFYPDYGKGLDGFMNTSSFIFLNVVPTLPLVFNGAGLIKAGEKGLEAALMVLDPDNIPTTSGLRGNLFDDGATVLGAYRIFTEFGSLPGSHLIAGTYLNRRITSYEEAGWITLPPGVPLIPLPAEKTGSWLAAYVGEQNLWVDPHDPKKRVFFLTTMGWADRKTSPFEWMGTYSIEALGLCSSRKHDRMGFGYFYADVSDDLEELVPSNVGLQDLQGSELYYNAQVTPWFNLTADIQFLQTEISSQDPAVVVGLRAKVTY